MHWNLEPTAGFTTGMPWEPLQPDSLTANVAAQDSDPGSLLNRYRRLIHLRASTPALGSTGEFVPLATGAEAALAYLRRSEEGTALVLANLGDRRLSGIGLSSAESVLAPGRYIARPLLGGGGQTDLRVMNDGRIRSWTPVPSLEPLAAHILELSRRD